jgi:hypothetical protein
MYISRGLSKEGKKLVNTSTEDIDIIKNKLGEEDLKKLEENVKKYAMKQEKQILSMMKNLGFKNDFNGKLI